MAPFSSYTTAGILRVHTGQSDSVALTALVSSGNPYCLFNVDCHFSFSSVDLYLSARLNLEISTSLRGCCVCNSTICLLITGWVCQKFKLFN